MLQLEGEPTEHYKKDLAAVKPLEFRHFRHYKKEQGKNLTFKSYSNILKKLINGSATNENFYKT